MNANAPNIDNTIDRALSTLRDAQPRSGLENRILSSLEHRTTELGGLSFHEVKGWGIARPGSPASLIAGVGGSARENAARIARLALWIATAAAVFAIASLIILHHRTAPTANGALASAQHPTNDVILSGARSAQSKNPAAARRATNPEPFSTTNLAQTTHTVSSRPAHRSSAAMRSGENPVFRDCSDHHNTGCSIQGDNVALNATSTTPTDAQLLADLHAPSHPAPPLPLTPQEKLFLRMLQYGNATQLAELNPIVRAKENADETTAFKVFFPDPPPLKQPLGDTE